MVRQVVSGANQRYYLEAAFLRHWRLRSADNMVYIPTVRTVLNVVLILICNSKAMERATALVLEICGGEAVRFVRQ